MENLNTANFKLNQDQICELKTSKNILSELYQYVANQRVGIRDVVEVVVAIPVLNKLVANAIGDYVQFLGFQTSVSLNEFFGKNPNPKIVGDCTINILKAGLSGKLTADETCHIVNNVIEKHCSPDVIQKKYNQFSEKLIKTCGECARFDFRGMDPNKCQSIH